MSPDQFDMFQTPPTKAEERVPYVSHSEPSREAADAIKPSVSGLRKRVLTFLERNGAATDEEMQDALEMNPSTQRPRRIELVAAGLVRDTGRTKKTRAGRNATLWEAK